MMKDYYKILGTKSDATDEEIRGRWIELVKGYHLDSELAQFDERVKDINDAYHVLKNPSTRLEYDLERTFQAKTKGFHLNKWFLRIGFGSVLVILCVIYFENPEIPYHLLGKSQTISAFTTDQKQLPVSEPQKSSAALVAREEASTAEPASPPLQFQGEAGVEKAEVMAAIGDFKQDPLAEASKPAEIERGDQQNAGETGSPASSGKLKPSKISRPVNEPRPASQTRDTHQASQPDRVNRTVAINSPLWKTSGVASAEKPAKMVQVAPSSLNPVKAVPPNSDTPSSLLAREDEVREFFLNYTKAYAQGNVEAFLALFSSKALQNQKENLEDLKGTYRRFFNRSRELHYQLQDLKFEIYKNGVEATARYELAQILKRNGEKRTWRGAIRWALTREDGTLKIITLDYQHQESL
jgi:hypothetical protein